MNIRSAADADADAVCAFWLDHAEPTSTSEIDAVAAVIANPATNVLLAEEGGMLVGTLVASWDGWRGHFYRLAVDETRRRQGIARALIGAGEASLRTLGARRVAAIVIDDHDYAVGTWRDSGYQRQDEVGRFVKMLG